MSAAPLHSGFLTHKRMMFAWLALLLVLAVAAAWYWQEMLPPSAVDLGFSYGLGTLALVIMLWLTWFGVRKRSYAKGAGRLKAWLSAHVYLGLSLVFLVPLHGGFTIAPDIHGIAYVLVLVTVFTGLFGVAFYGFYPRRVTANREGLTFDAMLKRIAEIDIELRGLSTQLSEAANNIVRREAESGRIGGGVGILFARPINKARRARQALLRLNLDSDAGNRAAALLESKAAVVDRLQRDIQMRSRLRAWLLLHVPLSLATLAAVIAHAAGMLMFGLGSV
ncbi:MAG: hypothetical protein JJ899_05345 [Alphaproteobacteria bacterium]|nr:hypothetical protein [Alphaproteobacteria bacterium]